MTKRGKKRLFVFTGIIVIAGAAAGGAYVAHRAQVQRIMHRGLVEGTTAFESGDYERAMDRLNDYAGRRQDNPEVMLMLAQARRAVPMANGRHLTSAVRFARAAAEAAPGDSRPHELLIDLYGELGMAGERVRAAEDLLLIEPKNELAMLARAETLAVMGRTNDALAQAEDLMALAPGNVRGLAVAVDLMIMASRPSADVRALVDRAVERNPDDVDFALVRASTLAALHESEEAIAEAKRASTLPTTSSEQIDRVVGLLDRLGLSREASAYLAERGQGLGAGSPLAVLAAERAWMNGDVDGARALLDGVLASPAEHSDDALGWAVFLAQAANDSGFDAAEQALRARTTSRARAWTRTVDGVRALGAGDATAARDAFSEANEYARRDRVAQALLGESYMILGDPDTAIRYWENLVRERPRWLTVRVSLINALLRRGRIDDAHQQAAATWTLWRDRLLTSSLLARTSVAMVETGRASDALRRDAQTLVLGLKQEPDARGEATTLEARLHVALGQLDKAQAAIDEILNGQAEPSAADLLALGELCRANGLTGGDRLLALAEAASAGSPDVALASARRSAAAGRADEGRTILRDGLARATGSAKREWERRLASYLDDIGDPAGLEMLKQAAVANPGDASAQIDLLTSRSVWSDEPAASAAIERLKGIVGERSLAWRVYEARRLLTFTPTDERAARAIETLAPVLRDNADHVGALMLAAEAYQRITPPNNERAAEMIGRAADADPRQPLLRVRHISLLQQMGRSDEAARRLRELVSVPAADPTLRRARADLLVRQGMWAEAQADLTVIAESGDLNALVVLAGVQVKQGRSDLARQTLTKLLAAPNASVSTLVGAAMLCAQLRDLETGERFLEAFPSSTPADVRAITRAQFYESAERHDRSEEVLRDAMKSNATADLWAEWAAWLARRARFDESRQALASAAKAFPNHEGLARAEQLVRVLQSEGSPEALALASAADPAIRALADAAKSFQEARDRAAYIVRLTAVRDQYPTSIIVRRELIRALMDAGDASRAEQEALAAAAAVPTSDVAARLAAEALAELGRLDAALTMAREWRNRSLEDPADAEIAIGQIEAMAGRPNEAIATLEKWKDRIIESADASPQPLIVFARQLAIVGRTAEADALLRPRASTSPLWASAYAAVGRVLVGNPPAARAWLERAAPLVASDTQARLLLGQSWFDLAGRTGQESDFRKVVEAVRGLETQEKAAAGLLLATSYDMLGEHAEAERCYRLAIEALPDNAAALNNFAYLLVKSGGSPSEAEALAERAVSSAQREGLAGAALGGMFHTLGEARRLGGRLAEAEQAFNRGLAADPSNPHLILGLVETHLAADRQDDASAAMQRLDAALRAGMPADPKFRDRLAKARETLNR